MTDAIIRFPASKRKFSKAEQNEVKRAVKKIQLLYGNTDVNVNKDATDIMYDLLRKIQELNEE